MLDFDVPDRAIQAFEEIHRLHVTVHDLAGTLWPGMKTLRHMHRHPLCLAAKASPWLPRCMDFDITQVRAALPECPQGRYHVCHAGLVEWIVPVFRELKLEWVLFAGVRTAAKELHAVRQPLTRWDEPPWSRQTILPPPVDADEAERILEHLRQVAARLWSWAESRDAAGSQTVPSDALAVRRTIILRFIDGRHREELYLSQLADELGVGEDRAGRIVKECCGRSFSELLIDARLRTAMNLLQHTPLPILEVAMKSGFPEIAHFNRLFRRRLGTTPGAYRRQTHV